MRMPPYKIRADMRVNGDWRKLVLVAVENEKPQHLALKLGAYLSFWEHDLILEASSKHTALMGQPFRPDLMAPDITGSMAIWVECGNTSLHKLTKVLRRWPDAKFAVFKEDPQKAERFRMDLEKEVPKSQRVEVYGWPRGAFDEWMRALTEKTEIFGEAKGVGFNLVVNETIYTTDLLRF